MAAMRVHQKVANQILELLDSGAFPPGARLPGERDLAQKFGVSRVSVREAEIALQAQGRIDIRVGSGVYVLSATPHKGHGMPKVGPFELTEARALFEAEAAALAAPIITDETLDELDRLIGAMRGESGISHEEADRRFHMAIAQATNNSAIVYTIDNMWKMRAEASPLQSVYKFVCHEATSHTEAEHRAILDALRSRDAPAARAAMRAHFARMIEALLDASEEEAYREIKRKASESRSRFLLSANL